MKSTILENQKNNRLHLNKNLFYIALLFIVLFSLISCTADEIQPIKNTNSTSLSAKDGEIDPPKPPTTPRP